MTPIWGTSCCQTTLFLRSSHLTGGHRSTCVLEYNNSQLADTGRSWKWHQQGGVCLELAHPADLMAIVEAVPSKPGKTNNDSLKLGV